MTIVEDFIEAEKAKMNRLERFFGNYPEIQPTKILANSALNVQFGEEKIIRPPIIQKIIAIPFLVFSILFWTVWTRMLFNGGGPFLFILFGFFFISFLIFLLLKSAFFGKRYHYTIMINKAGIEIRKNKFLWNDLAETCIMNKQEGRSRNSYLVIFKKDATIEKFDLFRFGISDRKLSTIIEYYKEENLQDK